MRNALLTTLIALVAAPAMASARTPASDCHAVMLAAVEDDMHNTWNKGQTVPVDIARDTPSGSAFCTHGGSCLPRKVAGHEAVRLADCKIGPSIGDGDSRLIALPRAHKR
ncbi:hypothetical protein [Xanthomonas sacchari]|uniref:Uncharacterized protein n=1 Tax=Xanthomonas sacchari TaxID=56458 RepID=A0A2P5Z7D2_9XANT|nr:hypothetical protein [Xanthomonas sacchari]MDV0437390.1 hypothetical protein [Xanthomonas sacchari]PPU84272.1 hypothetical protein XsacCFBP4641_04195 [Xanthomonas sacchari]